MDKNERLDILEQGNVISQQVRCLAENFIKELEEKLDVDWECESSMMFVTHLSVALDRMVKGTPIDEAPDEIKAQISEEDAAYIRTVEIVEELKRTEKITLNYTYAEILLISAYIVVIQKK